MNPLVKNLFAPALKFFVDPTATEDQIREFQKTPAFRKFKGLPPMSMTPAAAKSLERAIFNGRGNSRASKQANTRASAIRKRGDGTLMKGERTSERAAPSAMGFTTVMHSETEHRVRGLDLVSTVTGSTTSGTQLLKFPFYPAAIQNTRLQIYSSMWEKYRVNSLRYHIRCGATTQLVGTYVGYVDFDPLDNNDDTSTAVRVALDHQGSVESSMYLSSIVRAIQSGRQNMLYTQNAVGRTQDLLTHSVFYMVQNIPSTATVFASVLVEYDVSFYNAVNEVSLTAPQAAGIFTASNAVVTTSAPYGTLATTPFSVQVASNLNVNVTATPDQVQDDFYIVQGTTPALYFRKPGVFMVTHRWFATTVTTPSITVTTWPDPSYGTVTRVGTDITVGSTLNTAMVTTVVRVQAGTRNSGYAGYMVPVVTLNGASSVVVSFFRMPNGTIANWTLTPSEQDIRPLKKSDDQDLSERKVDLPSQASKPAVVVYEGPNREMRVITTEPETPKEGRVEYVLVQSTDLPTKSSCRITLPAKPVQTG